jgi:hypothetical protein
MRRLLTAGAAAALLLAAPAAAHEKKHAKVFKATLTAADKKSEVRGRAQLVDGRKHDKVTVHVKGLEPGETYAWSVQQEVGETDFTYRTLTAGPSGNASAKARSDSFDAGDGDFSVEVELEDGTVVASGDFERRGRGHKHGKDD